MLRLPPPPPPPGQVDAMAKHHTTSSAYKCFCACTRLAGCNTWSWVSATGGKGDNVIAANAIVPAPAASITGLPLGCVVALTV